MKVRPEVAEFAEAMEKVLRANDHKGKDIRGISPFGCLERLWEELRELDRATYGKLSVYTAKSQLSRMQREAVDVANFAAMFWLTLESWKLRNNKEKA